MSPTSKCNSTVAMGICNCQLTTIIWNSVEGPTFSIVCGASSRILRKSVSGMELDKALVFMRPSMHNTDVKWKI